MQGLPAKEKELVMPTALPIAGPIAPVTYGCWHGQLRREALITWPAMKIIAGKTLPIFRLITGDKIDEGCFDLQDFTVEEGFYIFQATSTLEVQLALYEVFFGRSRVRNIRLNQTTQSGSTAFDLNYLVSRKLEVKTIILEGGSSYENLIAKCRNGEYLHQGILRGTISFHTPVGVFYGQIENVTFNPELTSNYL